MGLKIVSVGKSLPKNVLTNNDLSMICDTNDEWIQSRTGISSRYIKSADETLFNFVVGAANEALTKANIQHKDIQVVICATLNGEMLMPAMANRLQSVLNLPETILSFDLNAACCGFIYALQTAEKLLDEGNYALIIGADAMSQFIDWQDRTTCVLFGDGAGAVVVQSATDIKTTMYAATISDTQEDLIIQQKEYNHVMKPILQMNGRPVFRFATQALQKSIEQVCQQAGVTPQELDIIISHQANIRIIQHVANKMGLPIERFYTNIKDMGNTTAGSVPIALYDFYQKSTARNMVLVGFGAGLTMGAIYLESKGEFNT